MHIPVYCLDKNYYPHQTIRETYHQVALLELHKQLLLKIKPDLVHVTHLINHTASLLDATKELGIPAIATLTDFFGICFNNRLEAANGSLCDGPNADRTNCLTCYLKARIDSDQAGVTASLFGRSPSSFPALAQALKFASRLPGLRHGSLASLVADIAERPDILVKQYATYQATIAPTCFLRHAYMANGLSTPMHVMHFGVDVPRTPKAATRVGAPVRFGYVGQIAPHKGTDILVDAFSRLPSGCAELHIYGSEDQDPEYVTALRNKAKRVPIFFTEPSLRRSWQTCFADLTCS
ncbi:MAG: hypothetical protein ACREBU_24845 [Nitrososphaera sp.]